MMGLKNDFPRVFQHTASIHVRDTQNHLCSGRNIMKKIKLDICIQPDQHEHARPMRIDDACDDGRTGPRHEDAASE